MERAAPCYRRWSSESDCFLRSTRRWCGIPRRPSNRLDAAAVAVVDADGAGGAGGAGASDCSVDGTRATVSGTLTDGAAGKISRL